MFVQRYIFFSELSFEGVFFFEAAKLTFIAFYSQQLPYIRLYCPNLHVALKEFLANKHCFLTLSQSKSQTRLAFRRHNTTYPITKRQILDSSKLKEFAYNNFKFDENGSKIFKRVENIVGKGEIARYKQFLLFSQCFQKACFPGGFKRCHCVGMG